jgi:hypothetical protein
MISFDSMYFAAEDGGRPKIRTPQFCTSKQFGPTQILGSAERMLVVCQMPSQAFHTFPFQISQR